MWKEKRPYIDVISRYFDVHATIGNTTQKKQDYDMSIVPGFVYNHGILRAADLQTLLKVYEIFISIEGNFHIIHQVGSRFVAIFFLFRT